MHETDNGNNSYYLHGTHPEEQDRLSKLNVILNQRCIEVMNLEGVKKILDVGSGLGQFTRVLAKTAPVGVKVLGLERDPEQIKTANYLAHKANESELVEFRQGDALHLPLQTSEKESFDFVHTRFLLEHVPKPELVIKEMLKAVCPGGRIFVSDDDHSTIRLSPEPSGFFSLWNAYMRSYDRVGNDAFVGRRLVSLLHQNGLKKIRNGMVFFGGCADMEIFSTVADNLIGVIESARDLIINENLLDAYSFDHGIESLHHWKQLPDAAAWYGLCWAEGTKQ